MTIEAILDECLDAIRQRRATIAECLARYPDQAAELEPLLKAALSLDEAPDVQPSPEFKRALRERIMGFTRPEEGKGLEDLFARSDADQKPIYDNPDSSSDEPKPSSSPLPRPAKRKT